MTVRRATEAKADGLAAVDRRPCHDGRGPKVRIRFAIVVEAAGEPAVRRPNAALGLRDSGQVERMADARVGESIGRRHPGAGPR
jgi:hypothetical protein